MNWLSLDFFKCFSYLINVCVCDLFDTFKDNVVERETKFLGRLVSGFQCVCPSI